MAIYGSSVMLYEPMLQYMNEPMVLYSAVLLYIVYAKFDNASDWRHLHMLQLDTEYCSKLNPKLRSKIRVKVKHLFKDLGVYT